MKTIFKILLFVAIISITTVASTFLVLNSSNPNIPINGIEFEIKSGDSAGAIAYRMKEQNLISSVFMFKVITRLSGLDKKLQQGFIQISSGEKTTDIIQKILTGDIVTFSITIPEGLNQKEISKLLVDKKVISQSDIDTFFAKKNYPQTVGLPTNYTNLDGFLFPETYTFYKGADIEFIFKTMVKLFYKKVAEINADYKKMDENKFYETIILASIIEKEIRAPEEAEIAAGVFLNRIRTGMKLQSCATVQYILPKPKEQLLDADLLTPSPYNTYLNDGLPPTPIANPGSNALKAAFNPTKTDYYYFVVKDPARGTHQFSATYAEHLRAQSRYKELKGFY